jgi:hypothetical protein
MARLSYEVKYYRVHLGSAKLSSGVTILGWLDCLDAPADWSRELIVYLVPEGSKLPPSFCDISEKRGIIYRPISQMSLYLDLLRNELIPKQIQEIISE